MSTPKLMYGRKNSKGLNRITAVAMIAFHVLAVAAFFFIGAYAIRGVAWWSLAAMVVCIVKGARIVRMHDVAATLHAVRMTEAILGLREPVRLEHNTHPTHNV